MNFRTLLLGSVAALGLAQAALAEDKELLVFDWAGFEDPGLHQAYTEKYGEPTYAFYADDDEAFQKIAAGFRADVGHPCSQMVSRYRDAGLIEPWDTSRIAAFADLDPSLYASPIFKDDKGLWFVPTDWASTAIAWNTEKVPQADVSTLQVFKDPKYAGRISLPNSVDDVWPLAFLATGVSDWTAVTDEQFKAAADWLREVHPNVRAYWADPSEMGQLMATGEVLIAWSWPEGVTQLVADGHPIGFQREATEGSSAFLCGYVNFKDGPGKEDKIYEFINAWLEPRSADHLLQVFGYGHSNKVAMDAMDQEKVKEAGLGPVSVPVLLQKPLPQGLRDRMVEEFEKIKAGF